jgi:hypothetical protein
VNGKTFKVQQKGKAKKPDTTKSSNEDPKNSEETDRGQETKASKNHTRTAEEQNLFTKEEITKVGATIFNLTSNLSKLNKMFQKNEKWSDDRKTRAKSLKELVDSDWVILNKFMLKITE